MSALYSPLLEVNDPKKMNSTGVNPPAQPVVPLLMNSSAPLAQIDEVDADHQGAPSAPLASFSGIDDGFFDERSRSSHGDDKTLNSNDDSKIPDFELTMPSTPDIDEIPSIGLRFGEDDDAVGKVDATDGVKNEDGKVSKANRSLLSPSPNFGMDFEVGSVAGGGESIPDLNIYQHKKTLAQGMMDLALFSANANQLRYVVESNKHPYYYPSVVLITVSLVVQVSKQIFYIISNSSVLMSFLSFFDLVRTMNFQKLKDCLVTQFTTHCSTF